MYCGKCGTELNQNGQCPNCDVKTSKNNNFIIILVVVLIIALLVGGIFYAVRSGFFNTNKVQNTYHDTVITQNTTTPTEKTISDTAITENSTTTLSSTTEATTTRKNYDEYEYNDYLFPSDIKLLTGEYLDTKSKNEIDLIRNEIYARHGYIFKMEQYSNYFIQKSWYKPIESDMDKVYDDFNSIEKQNIEILVEYQNLG